MQIRQILLIFSTVMCSIYGRSQTIESSEELWAYLANTDPFVEKIIQERDRYRLQLIYTHIDTNCGEKKFQTIDASSGNYYYPASTVKLPIALLTLEKLERLGISRNAVLKIHADQSCGNKRFINKCQSADLTFTELITEMLVISDNDYYNALFHFLGPEEINSALKMKGFTSTHLYSSFTGCDPHDQLETNACDVFEDGVCIYKQTQNFCDANVLDSAYSYDPKRKLGSKHENREGVIVIGPYDFNKKLEMSLSDLHSMMLRLIHPEQFEISERWHISDADRQLLLELLRMFPSDLNNAKYKDKTKYPDNIYKFMIHGEHPRRNEGVETLSKIGLSYGFTTETAYIICPDRNVAFLLTACMYTNANDIVNDGEYEYDSVARPFLSKISNSLLELEKSRAVPK